MILSIESKSVDSDSEDKCDENPQTTLSANKNKDDVFARLYYGEQSNQLDEEARERINSYWKDLKVKYGWMDIDEAEKKNKCCNFWWYNFAWCYFSWWKRIWWHLWYFVIGLFVFIFCQIPVVIILAILMVCCWVAYLLTCGCACRRDNKNAKKQIQSFLDFWRVFIGTFRLYLLRINTDMQSNLIYKFFDALVGYYQYYEMIYILSSGKDDIGDVQQKYYDLFGEYFPYLQSLCICDYKKAQEEIHSRDSIRFNATGGFVQSPEMKKYLFTHVLDTNTEEHRIAKDVAIILSNCGNFEQLKKLRMPWKQQDIDDNRNGGNYDKTGFLWRYCNNMRHFCDRSFHIHHGTLFYYMFNGAVLNDVELDNIGHVNVFTVSKPEFINFLNFYYHPLRKFYQRIADTRVIIAKHGGYKYEQLKDYATMNGLDIEIVLNTAAITIYFAGGHDAKKALTVRFTRNHEQEYTAYQTNPHSYILEASRQDSPIGIICNRAKEKIYAKTLATQFPKHCNVGYYLGRINQERICFGKDFVPHRKLKEFDSMMTFNTQHKNYQYDPNWCVINISNNDKESKDKPTLPPRHCPGINLQYFLIRSYIENLYALSKNIENSEWSLRTKLQNMFCPFEFHFLDDDDYNLGKKDFSLLIRPDAFRMLFYHGFFIFMLIGIIVSYQFSEKFNDHKNPISQRLGGWNFCIYFDNPPFTYFGAFLWFLLSLCLWCYEIFDFLILKQVYYSKKSPISRCAYKCYAGVTMFECFAFSFLVQSLATTPDGKHPERYGYYQVVEQGISVPIDIYWHTMPYMIACYAFLTLTMKRVWYHKLANDCDDQSILVSGTLPKWYIFIGKIYVVLVGITTICFTAYTIPNLFGLYLWKIFHFKGWIIDFGLVMNMLFTFLTHVCPILFHWKINKHLKTLKFTLNACENKFSINSINIGDDYNDANNEIDANAMLKIIKMVQENNGYSNKLIKILDHSVRNVNRWPYNRSIFYYAKKLQVIKFLFERYIDKENIHDIKFIIETKDSEGKTLLGYHELNQNEEIFNYLLKQLSDYKNEILQIDGDNKIIKDAFELESYKQQDDDSDNKSEFINYIEHKPSPKISRSLGTSEMELTVEQVKNGDYINCNKLFEFSVGNIKCNPSIIESINQSSSNIDKFVNSKDESKNKKKCAATALPIIIPIILGPFLEFTNKSSIFFCGIAMLTIFIVYFTFLFCVIYRCNCQKEDENCNCQKDDENCNCQKNDENYNLCRMYSLKSNSNNWARMNFTCGIIKFPKHPIASISELSAIDGGVAQKALLVVGSYAWSILLCAIILGASKKDDDYNKLNWGELLQLIGCFGLVMIGTNDLDPFNSFIQILHHFGVLLGLCTIGGYWYQEYILYKYNNNERYSLLQYMLLPFLLTIMALISGIMFIYYQILASMFPPDDSLSPPHCIKLFCQKCNCLPRKNYDYDEVETKQVTYVSKRVIIWESIFLISGALSLSFYLLSYDTCHVKEYQWCS